MPNWSAQSICNEAARLIQVKIGQAYADELYKPLNAEAEYWHDYRDWQSTLRQDSITLAVAATSFALPKKYKKMFGSYTSSSTQSSTYAITDTSTARIQLLQIYRGGTGPWSSVHSGPFNSAYSGDSCVASQPATAEVLKVKSSSDSDSSVSVVVIGEDNNGRPQIDTIITGATATTYVNGQLTFKRITSVSASKGTSFRSGYLSLVGVTSGTEYAEISQWETNPAYANYEFNDALTAACTMNYVAKLRFVPFLDKTQPPFMDGIGQGLVYGVCARAMVEFGKNDFAGDFTSMRDAELMRVCGEMMEPPLQRMNRA